MAEGKSTDSSLKLKSVINDDDSKDNEEDKGDLPDDLSLEKLSLEVPKKKLLVLCLGGLLCHRVCIRRGSGNVQTNRRPDAAYGSFKGECFNQSAEFFLFLFLLGIFSSDQFTRGHSAMIL